MTMVFFELQGDEFDEERVKLNLIGIAMEQGTLERQEKDGEIRFTGLVKIKLGGENSDTSKEKSQ